MVLVVLAKLLYGLSSRQCMKAKVVIINSIADKLEKIGAEDAIRPLHVTRLLVESWLQCGVEGTSLIPITNGGTKATTTQP